MEAHEIEAFIKNFNVVLVTALTLFAVFGIVALVGGKSRLNIFRNRVFLRAYCVAVLAAFALEVTVFNFPHYLKYFAGPELFTTEVSAEAPDRLLTNKAGYSVEIVAEGGLAGIRFRGLDMNLTSVLAEVDFGDFRMCEALVSWTDEEGSRGFDKRLYRGLPHENWITVQPHGKVSEFKVLFGVRGSGKGGIDVVMVALNRPIPFYFSGLRLLAVSILLFAAVTFFSRALRAKAAYYLFEREFDPASWKQNLVYALSVVALIFFSWACVYTTRYYKSFQEEPWQSQYNRYLTDAIIEGRVWLDAGNPEKLLNAERPYDYNWLVANGYKDNVDWMFDWAWYKGKQYCYFGAVPAVILYVPYKLVTGNYLSNHAGIFLFAAVAVILLSALWRHCVRRWMPGARFAFVLLSFWALYFASGFYTVLSFPRFYVIVQAAGFMFALAGVLLLFKAVEREKVNGPILFFACLCLALIVGCRPNMIFVSLLVPVLLWKRRSWKLLLPVMIPYVLVAIPICAYNYARFGSIFDFGATHNLSAYNLHALTSLNPIGLVIRWLIGFVSYFLWPCLYSLKFPYVECFTRDLSQFSLGFFNLVDTGNSAMGIINFPIVFCLFYMFRSASGKDRPEVFNVLRAFLIVAVSIVAVNAVLMFCIPRYFLDFATFIILPSLFCAYFWSVCPKSGVSGRVRLKVVYVLLAVSILVGLFLFATGGMNGVKDLTMYRYLEYSLGFIRNF